MLTAVPMDHNSTVALRCLCAAILLGVVLGLAGCAAPPEEAHSPESLAAETALPEAPAAEGAATEAPAAAAAANGSASAAEAGPARDPLHLRGRLDARRG